MIEKTGWEGSFAITIKDKSTGEVKEEIILNRLMDAGLNALADCLAGSPDIEIKYLALGTSNTPVSDSQTQLGNEIFRTQPTSGPTRTATGQIETEFVVLDNDAVGTIEEVGIFCGSSASSAANTGKLLTRILWHKEKTSSEEITFRRLDKVVRA